MARRIPIFTGIVLLAALAGPAAGAPEPSPEGRPIQFALTGTLLFGYGPKEEIGAYIGPGVRIDLHLGKLFMICPEVFWVPSWRTVSPACTLNLRFNNVYFGLGPMLWKDNLILKARLGLKYEFTFIEGVYVRGGATAQSLGVKTSLVGMAVGFVF